MWKVFTNCKAAKNTFFFGLHWVLAVVFKEWRIYSNMCQNWITCSQFLPVMLLTPQSGKGNLTLCSHPMSYSLLDSSYSGFLPLPCINLTGLFDLMWTSLPPLLAGLTVAFSLHFPALSEPSWLSSISLFTHPGLVCPFPFMPFLALCHSLKSLVQLCPSLLLADDSWG